MIKVIDSIQYHVWSDALHARELARQTESPWDRGAYVRWTIQTAWSAFENVCTDALQALSEAERAISVLRDGIKAVSDLVGLPHPPWVADDEDRGWQKKPNSSANLYVTRAGVQADDPQNVRIAYVIHGREHLTEIALPNTPHGPLLDRLVDALNIPVEAVRAYRGIELIEERSTKMRL